MPLSFNLPPELEEYLIEKASRQDLPVETVLLDLLSSSMQKRKKKAAKNLNWAQIQEHFYQKARLTRSQKSHAAVDLLQSWLDDQDDWEQQETGHYLIQALDEDRLSDRKLFPPDLRGITW